MERRKSLERGKTPPIATMWWGFSVCLINYPRKHFTKQLEYVKTLSCFGFIKNRSLAESLKTHWINNIGITDLFLTEKQELRI
jgi:hypothetical protein